VAGQPFDDATVGLSVVRGNNIPADAKQGLGAWIWTDKTFDRQSCRLWKEFEVPPKTKVLSARMRMTADNGYRFYLDGRELGQGADWRGITAYDLTDLLQPGHHVLAVDAFNDYFQAGLILVLSIDLDNGQKLDIKSDTSWRIVPDNIRGWEKMKHADPGWPQAIIIPTESVSQWIDNSWPYDYVTVPPFHPLVIPLWQRPTVHILLACASGLVFSACVVLGIRLMVHSKEQRLLNLERARIARDIHDDFGTRLTRLVLEGEMAKSELSGNDGAGERLSRITTGLREALDAMDEVLWAVNPRRDTVKDFVTYLCEYAQTFLKPAGIQCLLDVEPHIPPLGFDLPLRRSLLLAVKEAINNVARHSRASRMSLHICRNSDNLTVIVEDDGIGFHASTADSDRHGLKNMVQRLNEVGGACEIISSPGIGTRIEFRMPLTRGRPSFRLRLFPQSNRPRKTNRPPSPQPRTGAGNTAVSNTNK
ncbi:MAG TPA: histidine kinase, partial [Candidatus Paceibacterota bacterium]|nr:histidine kinase [Candidatus Paceibacterota bacterium]